jgi:hypothetical protein
LKVGKLVKEVGLVEIVWDISIKLFGTGHGHGGGGFGPPGVVGNYLSTAAGCMSTQVGNPVKTNRDESA